MARFNVHKILKSCFQRTEDLCLYVTFTDLVSTVNRIVEKMSKYKNTVHTGEFWVILLK